jgi:hypothetical protein
MSDPFTLSAIGGVALAEGIKFLYQQTGDALKRWRERRSAASAKPNAQTQSIEIKLPPVFEGQLLEPKIHFDAVDRLEPQLRAVRQELSSFADETSETDATNEDLLDRVDSLRLMLEAIYQQRITFKGEDRPASGTTIEGLIDVEKVEGYVAGVRARSIKEGSVSGTVKANEVGPEGTAIGVDILDRIE